MLEHIQIYSIFIGLKEVILFPRTAVTELSLAKYIVFVNVTTLLPKALKTPREDASEK